MTTLSSRVPSFVTRTSAFGTVPPDGSVTSPLNMPVVEVWPEAIGMKPECHRHEQRP